MSKTVPNFKPLPGPGCGRLHSGLKYFFATPWERIELSWHVGSRLDHVAYIASQGGTTVCLHPPDVRNGYLTHLG